MLKGGSFLKILLIILAVLFILFILLVIDFTLGRSIHLKKFKRQIYPVRQSDIKIFTTGPELFSDYFSELKKAKRYIHVLFYIVKKDQISTEFLTLLKEKAQEGIEVKLMLDWVGSLKVDKNLIKQLEDAGGKFVFTHKSRPPFFYWLQVRNHRKITVVDGKISYLGGFNVGKEYIDLDPKLSPWRDYHLKISGEGVQDLQHMFLLDWEEAAKVHLQHTDEYYPQLEKGPYEHQYIPSEGFYLVDTFSHFIREAEHTIMIGSPYFIPGKRILRELEDALRRGVKLEILVPMTADHPFVKEASFPYLRKLIKQGATVYQYTNGFYHAKILIIDDKACDIGTANFDKRSFFLNHEMNCFVFDKQYIKYAKDLLKGDQANAHVVQLNDLRSFNPWKIGKELIARLISFFL